jgi:hypothetical protein
MSRLVTVLVVATFTCVACGDAVQSVSSPTPATAAVGSSSEGAKQHNITGTVMSVEKPGRFGADAKIEVVGGADTGRATQSDAAGNFVLANITAGAVSLRVSKAGYQSWAKDDISLEGDRKVAVELFVEPPRDAGGVAATGRCNDGSWTWAPIVAAACTNNGGLAYGVCPGPLCKSQ